MTINLNTNPFYDDFTESKNYLKVLFRPGYSIQARELTQLQTSLQKQISSFGSHVFKDGSIVLGGNTSVTNINWIDVLSTNISKLSGVILGISSGAKGKIFLVKQINSTTSRIYFNYFNGLSFAQAETISIFGVNQFDIVDKTDYIGVGNGYSIEESVFFVKGYFVYCENQKIVVSDGTPATAKLGLVISESIVTSVEDETLLDPAQGSYNFAAPGADRFSISLTLSKFDYDPQTELAESGDFIELSRFIDDKLVSKVSKSSYSDLETNLARRTYDESGDYTVNAFGLKVKDHVYGDTTKLSLAINPGKAYIKGYEFETIATINYDLEKARTYSEKSGQQVQADFGDYIIINTPTGGLIDYSDNESISALNSVGVVVGTMNVRSIMFHKTNQYRLYVYNAKMLNYNSVSNIKSFKSLTTNWVADVSTDASEYSTSVYLIKSFNNAAIISLPNYPIKSLLNNGISDTSLVVNRVFPVIFSSDSVTINTNSSNELFLGNLVSDFIVVNQANGSHVIVTSVTGSGMTRTVNISGASGISAKIYTKIGISSVIQKNKSLITGTKNNVAVSSGIISLDTSDCYELISVMARDTDATPLPSINVSEYFEFDTGQTDEFYDHGSIKLKKGLTIPANYDLLDITFSYFTQSTTSGYFSADSYTGVVPYEKIPKFVSSSGSTYSLRDCLDFRPRKTNVQNSTTFIGKYDVVSNSIVSSDYSYYLSRIDKLVLTKERKFDVVKGIPAEHPTSPNDLYDAMTLYVINVPAYTNTLDDVSYSYIDNRRYTMRDIGKIDKRVERIESYTRLTLLEKMANEESLPSYVPGIDRFKNGILVDSFSGHSVGDVNNKDYACSIDPENKILRPKFAPFSFNYVVNSISNGTKIGDLITLPHTKSPFIIQPFATSFVNLNPYLVFSWNGLVTIDPPTDTWIDTYTRPDVTINVNGENDIYTTLTTNVNNPASIGVRWNDWQTVSRGTTVDDNISTTNTTSITNSGSSILQNNISTTTNNQTTTVDELLERTGISISTSSTSTSIRDIGTRVVDTSIVPFIRSRVVKFAAKNLKPNTNILASFDGVDVSHYCNSGVEVILNNINSSATKIRTLGSEKEASIILTKNDRVFVVMDVDKSTFTPNDVVQWLIGGVWVSSSTISAVSVNAELQTNEFGDVAGTFLIPNSNDIKFRTGERTLRLSDVIGVGATTAAEVKYIAQGMSQSVERTLIATRVATVSINPVSETTTKSITTTNSIVISSTNTVVDITPPPPPPPPPAPLVLTIGDSQSGNGGLGKFVYTLKFGSIIGNCGITFNSFSIPDRYTIIWDGKTYSSGFTGSSSYNDRLNALGFPNVTGLGTGQLIFNKTSALPETATLIVDAPLPGTGWNFKVVAPSIATIAPPIVPLYVIQGNVSINSTISIMNNTYFNLGQVPASINIGFGFVSWKANSVASFLAKYKCTNIVTNNSLVTVSFNNNTETSANMPVGFTLVSKSGLKPSSIAITATFEYVGGDALIPTTLRTVVVTKTINFLITSSPPVVDPVAQTFFVNANEYPNGVFVSDIDLFFKTKSSSLPVQVQIRPTVNGYPSSTTVLPFGLSSKDATDVVVSQLGTLPTNFIFDNIVHLSPGEYAFVVMANTDEYEIFTARLGEFSLNDSSQRVTSQPSMGSMFKSQNASTWTPVQEEDIKFTLNKCVFDISQESTIIFDTDISENVGDVPYDMFYTMGEVVDFAQTNIDYFYKTTDNVWGQYQIGTNVAMNSRKVLSSSDKTTLQFKTVLKSEDSNITPVVDLNRLSNNLIKNVINYPTTSDVLDLSSELESSGGNALSKYITRKVKLDPEFASTDLKVFFSANIPSSTEIRVFYKVASTIDTYFDDNNYVEMILESASSFSESIFSEYKYKTINNVAIDGDRFDTFCIKLVFVSSDSTKIPQVRSLRVIALDD